MSSFLRKTIFFSFFAFITYFFFLILWGEFSPHYLKDNLSYQKLFSGHLTSRLKEVETVKKVDILFLGSSRSYRHYDPRIFKDAGLSSFNLGSSSQTMIQTEYFVNKYLDHLDPSIVVFDIYPGMFSADGVESTLDVISNEELNGSSIKLAVNHYNIKVYNTLIYAFYRQTLHGDHKLKEEKYKLFSKDTYISGGFVEKDLEFSIIEGDRTDFNRSVFLNKQINAFIRIIEKLRDSERKIILVSSPSHRAKKGYYRNYRPIDSILDQLELSLRFYDQVPGLNDTLHFYDPHHLNQDGVEIYNKFFLETMEF